MVSEDLSQGAQSQPISLIVVCGATGSGKGSLARGLARERSGELVSADSRKIYRRLNIGTAKPGAADLAAIPHHLIDVCDPDTLFSASRYRELALAAVYDIVARERLPIVAGGTGLYIRALLHGIIDTPARDEAIRAKLEKDELADPGCLHRRLVEVDPQLAQRLPQGDVLRQVRALEVFQLTGKPLSEIQQEHRFSKSPFRSLQLAIDWPREELYQRIDSRVERLMDLGWLDECRELLDSGVDQVRQVVGYRQLVDHLEGACTLAQSIAAIQQSHRRYARQQLTWFRKNPDIVWLPAPVDSDSLAVRLDSFLVDRR